MKNFVVKTSVVIAAASLLAGCDTTSQKYRPEVVKSVTLRVEKSVAKKVLGEEAISVDPFTGNNISTPGIYRAVKNGSGGFYFKQICEHDTSQQLAIKEMRSDRVPSTEIVEDSLSPVRIKVTVLGKELSQPYTKIKVSSYSIKRVYSGSSVSPEDWILNNVADDCKKLILPKNKPYLVVTAVATADNVETVTGGGIAETSFAFGVFGIQSEAIKPVAEGRRSNRVFAIEGKFVGE
ncbi:hypothetical protein H4S14_000756 [Agrobacterium vitis]|nr:hypothetical protein [Agrobacterium vitis]MBE1437029.1 hypothetical protein [Agrobacterium vitis]